MIQAIMLIALGFLTAALIGVLLAPSFWSRASRLSKKRLESTLPLTLAEIEASQDQLRASYAVRLRRLESTLASAKQKAANQLVDNSRLQMQIVALKDQIADLELQLSERRNAATVLEQTITKRFPALDREITTVKAQLQERSYELQDLTNKLARRDEEIESAQAAAAAYQEELQRLHQVLEKSAADRSGRRVRRASQWDLEDYRSEYDRLNLELSKMRQQLALYQDRDAQQVYVIKGELQKLAESILASAQPRSEPLQFDRPEAPKRVGGQEVRRERPLPWRESTGTPMPLPARVKLSPEPPSQERLREPAARPTSPQPVQAEEKAAPPQTGGSLTLSPVLKNIPEETAVSPAAANGHETGARARILQEVVPANSVQQAPDAGPGNAKAVETTDEMPGHSLSKPGNGAEGGVPLADSPNGAEADESRTKSRATASAGPSQQQGEKEAPARGEDEAILEANGVHRPDPNDADAGLEEAINVDALKTDPEHDKIGPHQPRLLERLRSVGQ